MIEHFFIISGSNIRIYSTTTGERIRDLEGIPNNRLISQQIDLHNQKLLYGCTDKGDIISWKWKSGVIHEKQALRFLAGSFPLVSGFALISLKDERAYGLVTWKAMDSEDFQIGVFDLSNGFQQDLKLPLKLK